MQVEQMGIWSDLWFINATELAAHNLMNSTNAMHDTASTCTCL